MALLEVDDVTRRFGGIVALADVSLSLEEGTIGGLIGPNGAGKTTLFNVITRLYKPDGGRVVFDERNLLRARHRTDVPERRALPVDDGARERARRRSLEVAAVR